MPYERLHPANSNVSRAGGMLVEVPVKKSLMTALSLQSNF
jgi:hypothetical protein